MAKRTVTQALKAKKSDLEKACANHRVLSIAVSGLVMADHDGIPSAGWHDEP
jgi:hypothetical protein